MKEATYNYWKDRILEVMKKNNGKVIIKTLTSSLKVAYQTISQTIDRMLSEKLITEERIKNRRWLKLK